MDLSSLIGGIEKMDESQKKEVLDFILHRGKYESRTNKVAKLLSRDENLNGVAAIAAAPINALETSKDFLFDLGKKETTDKAGEAVEKLLHNPTYLKIIYDTFINQLSATQKIAVGIESSVSSLALARFIIRLLDKPKKENAGAEK